MVCSKNYVIDIIIRYFSNNFFQYVKELYQMHFCKRLVDVKIMNLQTLSHINILKNSNQFSNMKLIVEDIGVEPTTLSLQS